MSIFSKTAPDTYKEADFFNLSNTYFNYVNNAKADDNSDEIIKKINTLSYDELKIELIPYTFKTVDLFICIDEEAENFWIKYKEIYSKNNNANRYEKQAEFNKIKRDFLFTCRGLSSWRNETWTNCTC